MSSRKPREWLVVWVYRCEPSEVVEKIEEIQPLFQDELLEVCCPSVVEYGYIFVRVASCSSALLLAIKQISGVGGFLNPTSVETLEELEFDSQPDSAVKLNDKVVVRVSPLKGHTGVVVEEREDGVDVRLSIFGRMLRVKFQLGEVEVYKKAPDGGVPG